MPSETPGIPASAIGALFPFHVMCDGHGVIVSVGPALARLCPAVTPGVALPDVAVVEPDFPGRADAARLEPGQMVSIRPFDSPVHLNGRCVDAGEHVLFAGTARASEVSELTNAGIRLGDLGVGVDGGASLASLGIAAVEARTGEVAAVNPLAKPGLSESGVAAPESVVAEPAPPSESGREGRLERLQDLAGELWIRMDRDGRVIAARTTDETLQQMVATAVGMRANQAFPFLAPKLDGVFAAAGDGPVSTTFEVERAWRGATRHYDVRMATTDKEVALVARDSSERRRVEERLVYHAFHDQLTGLANRSLFHEWVSASLERDQPGPGELAVLFLDLDDFKLINDLHGHVVGDHYLAEIARRLSSQLRSGDTAGRLGGDEFAVLMRRVGRPEEMEVVAHRLVELVRSPVLVDRVALSSGVSVGVAPYQGAETANEMLRNADLAMYRAKKLGKGRVVVFEKGMLDEIVERSALKRDLAAAIHQAELTLQFQPIVDMTTGRVVAFEALARWYHPQRGVIPTPLFVGIAEETGLVVPMGRKLLGEACTNAVRWLGPDGTGPAVHVNLSARQLQDPDLLHDLRSVLARTGLPASLLTLEITESMLMSDLDTAAEVIGEIKELGIEVALDDFGTGFSSLTHLHHIPVDTLKIDKSFVTPLGTSGANTLLVEAIVSLGEVLGLDVVAEGVETEEQITILRDLGCVLGQGFVLSTPLEAHEAIALLDFLRPHVGHTTPEVGSGVPAAR